MVVFFYLRQYVVIYSLYCLVLFLGSAAFEFNRWFGAQSAATSTFEMTISVTVGLIFSTIFVASRYRKFQRKMGHSQNSYIANIAKRKRKKMKFRGSAYRSSFWSLLVLFLNFLPFIFSLSDVCMGILGNATGSTSSSNSSTGSEVWPFEIVKLKQQKFVGGMFFLVKWNHQVALLLSCGARPICLWLTMIWGGLSTISRRWMTFETRWNSR